MIKKPIFLLFFCMSLVFLFSGCLDCEMASLSIDLIDKVAEIKYFNIVSNSRDEDTIKKDFRELIQKVYFDDDSKSDPDRITSRKLYRDNERLDGMIRFSFKHPDKVLKEFKIDTDQNGDYIIDVTKEVENFQVSGSGQFIERDSKKLFKWPKNVKKIEFETKSKVFDESEKTRLLKNWQDWVDKSVKE